jgi:hypothetical protein
MVLLDEQHDNLLVNFRVLSCAKIQGKISHLKTDNEDCHPALALRRDLLSGFRAKLVSPLPAKPSAPGGSS